MDEKDTAQGRLGQSHGQKTMPRDGSLLQGVTRPKIGADRCQSAIVVGDASASMQGAKIDALNLATAALLKGLQDPKARDAFSFALVAYGDKAKVHLDLRKATKVDPAKAALSAGMHGPNTNVTDGLAKALQLVRRTAAAPGAPRPIVLLLTDGVHNMGAPEPEGAADELKREADLVCVAFGADADFGRLERLANTPAHAVRCDSGTDLRGYFVQVATTMASAAKTGQSAAALLGQSQVLRG